MRNSQKIAIAVILVLFIVGGATAPGWIRWLRVQRDFQKYSEALVKADYKEAYGYCSSAFAAETPEPTFEELQKSIVVSKGLLRSVRQISTSVEGTGTPLEWRATVRAEFVYVNGSLSFVYELRPVNGQWKVWGYQAD